MFCRDVNVGLVTWALVDFLSDSPFDAQSRAPVVINLEPLFSFSFTLQTHLLEPSLDSSPWTWLSAGCPPWGHLPHLSCAFQAVPRLFHTHVFGLNYKPHEASRKKHRTWITPCLLLSSASKHAHSSLTSPPLSIPDQGRVSPDSVVCWQMCNSFPGKKISPFVAFAGFVV